MCETFTLNLIYDIKTPTINVLHLLILIISSTYRAKDDDRFAQPTLNT